MRTAIIALAAAAGFGMAAYSTGPALAEGGCTAGWHPVPGHWAGGDWMPTRCAPNNAGGDWSSPYPAYQYQAYPAYPTYAVPYEAYAYPAEPYWGWRPY